MSKIDILERAVKDLYESHDPNREEWADWLYKNHVFVVADFAEKLARRFNADVAQCRAAAVLHDIADVEMSRFDPNHAARSLEIARILLAKAGFGKDEVLVIVDDAITFHGCRDGQRPKSLAGKVLSTADALAHLKTNFYEYTTENLMAGRPEEQKRTWAANKVWRDYNEKIAFEQVRKEIEPEYKKLSELFSNKV